MLKLKLLLFYLKPKRYLCIFSSESYTSEKQPSDIKEVRFQFLMYNLCTVHDKGLIQWQFVIPTSISFPTWISALSMLCSVSNCSNAQKLMYRNPSVLHVILQPPKHISVLFLSPHRTESSELSPDFQYWQRHYKYCYMQEGFFWPWSFLLNQHHICKYLSNR